MKTLRFVLVSLILLLLGAFVFFAIKEEPQTLVIQILENQNNSLLWLLIVISGLTLVSTLAGLPVLYFSIALGFFLPFTPALIFAWIINLAAVMLTFIMVRSVFSEYFREKYGKRKVIRIIDSKILKYGFWPVTLARSVYVIPTNIINYSFPLGNIQGKHYLIGTAIGLIPESLINVISGYLLKQQMLLLSEPEQNLLKLLIISVFLLIILLGILFLNFRRRKVKQARMNEILPPLQED
ncbi:TVP38/TMEM64 family protein [Bacteroidota bacterium]